MMRLPDPPITFLGQQVRSLPFVDSTNTYLKQRGTHLPDGAACYTDDQRAGRGRRGKAWTAEKGQALALSVLLRPRGGPETSLLCGLAVARALTQLIDAPFRIKWPNDILCSGQKVVGILCENVLTGTDGFTVAGIGVNLSQTPEDFVRAGLPHAASLWMLCGSLFSPAAVAAAILGALEPLILDARRSPRPALQTLLSPWCATLGHEVRVLSANPADTFDGRAVALADDGALVVETADGTRLVRAGEVSVRGLYGYS